MYNGGFLFLYRMLPNLSYRSGPESDFLVQGVCFILKS